MSTRVILISDFDGTVTRNAFQPFGRWADVADALLAFGEGGGRCV